MDLQPEEPRRASSHRKPQRGEQPLYHHRRPAGAQETQSSAAEEQPDQTATGETMLNSPDLNRAERIRRSDLPFALVFSRRW